MTKKQERDRARRRWEKRQASLAARAAQRERAKRLIAIIATVLAVAAIAGVLAWRLNSSDATSEAAASPSPSVSLAKGCEQPPKPLGTSAKLTLPDARAVQGKTYTATLTTSCGEIVIEMQGAKAPQAVASFQQLATSGYWLNSPCHRLVVSPGMTVLQCGDPTGTGSGEPGYGYAVENAPKDGVYQRGVVAMARTTDPKAGTGGQFFIVDQKTTIPDPDGYTVLGTVTQGLDIVDSIVAGGVAPGGPSQTDGAPRAPISILRVAMTEKKA